ncbi:glucose-1-phosphate thymidylyltransferase [Bacteroidota bacterium]|nr:glucose-1-phosphate thymidylyltransferase [Bacteroidota bacterium]
MINIHEFINGFTEMFSDESKLFPWEITGNLNVLLEKFILKLNADYNIENGIAIHKSATIEQGVVLKAPVIISENCFVGANAYLRAGVYLDKSVTVGPGCEIKSSIMFANTTIAHFNFIGDSIIGNNVNFEAGAHTANHYNERTDKRISVSVNGKIIQTNSEKFGALVGDHSKIGANAVLSPGTILTKNSIVKRLELVEQIKNLKPHCKET